MNLFIYEAINAVEIVSFNKEVIIQIFLVNIYRIRR
jgi:hypothetical protein